MYAILSGLTADHCLVYLDVIIVFNGNSIVEHLSKFEMVFKIMREHSLKFKPTKYNFLKSNVMFLGYVISSSKYHTITQLTRKDIKVEWTEEQQKSFDTLRDA